MSEYSKLRDIQVIDYGFTKDTFGKVRIGHGTCGGCEEEQDLTFGDIIGLTARGLALFAATGKSSIPPSVLPRILLSMVSDVLETLESENDFPEASIVRLYMEMALDTLAP